MIHCAIQIDGGQLHHGCHELVTGGTNTSLLGTSVEGDPQLLDDRVRDRRRGRPGIDEKIDRQISHLCSRFDHGRTGSKTNKNPTLDGSFGLQSLEQTVSEWNQIRFQDRWFERNLGRCQLTIVEKPLPIEEPQSVIPRVTNSSLLDPLMCQPLIPCFSVGLDPGYPQLRQKIFQILQGLWLSSCKNQISYSI